MVITRKYWHLIASLAFGPGAMVVVPAAAQSALGTGNALDHNLSPTSGGINSPVPIEDFRLRNQIITGNVAGGRGFRGSVGYTAENDFRGRLGSNELFSFRADSAYSDPSIFGFGRSFDQ